MENGENFQELSVLGQTYFMTKDKTNNNSVRVD
jgi:hypothetical protein